MLLQKAALCVARSGTTCAPKFIVIVTEALSTRELALEPGGLACCTESLVATWVDLTSHPAIPVTRRLKGRLSGGLYRAWEAGSLG
eukprot:COSAG01_NODE_1283_length_10920_cov_5.539507_7_plen_86_part_00